MENPSVYPFATLVAMVNQCIRAPAVMLLLLVNLYFPQ